VNTTPSERWRSLGEFIRDRRLATSRSIRDVARVSGISNPYLSQIERGIRRPSAGILQRIARGLEVSAETLYEQAGLLEPTGDDAERDPGPVAGTGIAAVTGGSAESGATVEAAVLADARLDASQKAEIIALYRRHLRDT
jgi:transcriptional regulator with XRE-family HTH domain